MVWKPHTTVAAIIERGNKFLTVEELVLGEQAINQPAGHLDSKPLPMTLINITK